MNNTQRIEKLEKKVADLQKAVANVAVLLIKQQAKIQQLSGSRRKPAYKQPRPIPFA